MKVVLLGLLLALPALGAKSSGCDFKAGGFDRPQELKKFFAKLKTAAAKPDAVAIAKMANYPLRVGKKDRIRNETVLKRKFPSIFTPAVLQAITSQREEDLYCDVQGARIGHGEVWIQQVEGVVVITNVNK